MSLTIRQILRTQDDEVLFKLLCAELERLTTPYDDAEDLLRKLLSLPIGLRAMGATYHLDVSMTLDDLGFHFANWPSQNLARLTISGLAELGATKEAEVFQHALELATPYWQFITASSNFVEWYYQSELEKALGPLNTELWELMALQGDKGTNLLSRWAPYARLHPDRICNEN